ncbi:uncharacterized protein LOC103315192 isoform X2 [Tribolium castaneum]|uniref:Insulin-like peptide n=2 Tax=Tribolium castaneum TaxID=7070 RepID=D6W956_TRICA|nr:PREDICTED: uncharacterized protein LOC103315192 isoform X2 [Tribolium castaneum]EEZ99258.2 insulin-like peptide [Tribolium castaneum]|eukprot:XP_008201468.1 PREDICTED: uncharacterized protein LOC103315192 isoform X2 [Tribolium castaneum]
MNVPKLWLKVCFTLLLAGQIHANIDRKEFFCGKKLVKTLTELCAIYNYPTLPRRRFRRQIVDECCRSQCSRRYLVQYYCMEAHSSIAHLLKAKPEPEKPPERPVEAPKETPVGTTPSHISPNHGHCKCRKRRAKRINKSKRMQGQRNFIHNPVPPANIGHVERSQTPFYIWKFSRVY